MLNSLFIISYYGFIRTYWTAKQNAARTNIDLAFSRVALAALAKHQTDNDTTANQTLLDTEAAAQSAFLTATQGNRAGVVTDEELATSLTTYSVAKASRREAIPNCQAITNSITQQAQETFELFQLQYNNKVNAKSFFGQDAAAHQSELDTYKSYLIYAQSLRDTAADFAEKLDAYVTMSEQKLDVIETTGKAPETYQDIIDASNYTFDGTYSDAVNHIAPNGKIYGQTTIVQKIEHLYWWAGEKWYRIPDEVDQAASVSLLPAGEPFGTIFRIPSTRYNATTSSYEWDYYLSTGDGWELMTEYWTIEGIQNVHKLTGYHVGDYHKVIERAVPVYWDGFEHQRQRISVFVDDIGITTELGGLAARADTTEDNHANLLESYLGSTSTGNEALDDVAIQKAAFLALLDSMSDSGWITLAESLELKKHLGEVVSESATLIAIANSLEESVEDLDLSTEINNYETAITNLTAALASWVDAASYPVEITGAVTTRSVIETRIELVRTTREALRSAVQNANFSYVDGQISELDGSLSTLTSDVGTWLSDAVITQLESQTLSLALAQLQSESTDVIAIAVTLAPNPEPNPKSAITLAKEAYVAALAALVDLLDNYLDVAPTPPATTAYPITVTVEQRAAIEVAFGLVQSTKSALTKEMQAVNEANLGVVSGDLGDLASDVADFSSDLTLMLSEANSLDTQWVAITKEYDTLVTIAGPSGLNRILTNINAAYDALHAELDTKWVGQASYPVTLESGDRAILAGLLEDYEEEKTLIVSAISAQQASNVSTQTINDFKLSIYNGFVPGFTPDLEMAYISKNELGLKPKTVVGETSDEAAIRKQLAAILEKAAVHIYTPVLNYTTPGGVVTLDLSEIEELNTTASYYVYLANQHEDFATSIYDYRGKLFCSTVTPSDNLWINDGDFDAILIGTVETQTESGKIVFEHEYGTSLVSRESDVKETFREYSDFDLRYTDEDTITLERIYGTYGQIYVPERLYYIGESKEVITADWTVKVNVDNTLSLDAEGVVADTLYYAYIGADTDIYNFNALAGTTPDRPLHPGETGYDADKDFRLDIFLSTQPPDNMRLAETYYGYWARHIGQVRTDGTGKFIYSGGVSAIRQATLNPTYFDGLAEISLQDVSTTTFKVIRKRGTSGIVMVGSKGVLTYDSDNPLVHAVTINDTVYAYNEATPSSPLSSTGTILDVYIGRSIHLYLANDRPCWGGLANRTFLSVEEPTDAYLSQNYPGNNARWIAEIQLASGARGAELVTDGNLEDSNDWDGHGGWGWSELNLNAYHNTGNILSLDQISMTVVAGGTYELLFITSGVSAGSVTPRLGNTNGTPVTAAGHNTQYIIATNTDVLKFVPTSDFNGTIDTVSCKKVEHGAFAGSYIVDSIAKTIPYLDDTIVSATAGWSSSKIMQVVTDYLGYGAASGSFIAEKSGGLNVRLEYLNATTISLIPASGSDSPVIFEDGSSIVVPAAGFTKTVSGAANTRYYVYVRASTEDPLLISATPPDNLYTKLETLGTANIHVGDICMTSTNTMSGSWNVCSSHKETSLEWTLSITGSPLTFSLPGLILSKRTQVVASRTGATYTGAVHLEGSPTGWLYIGPTSSIVTGVTSGTYTGRTTIMGIQLTVGISPQGITDTEGIVSSPSWSYSDSAACTFEQVYSYGTLGQYYFVTERSGNIVVTRSQP